MVQVYTTRCVCFHTQATRDKKNCLEVHNCGGFLLIKCPLTRICRRGISGSSVNDLTTRLLSSSSAEAPSLLFLKIEKY